MADCRAWVEASWLKHRQEEHAEARRAATIRSQGPAQRLLCPANFRKSENGTTFGDRPSPIPPANEHGRRR